MAWEKHRPSKLLGRPADHWYSEPFIHRTPKGWVVTQYVWWETRAGEVQASGSKQIGYKDTSRWFRDEAKARAFMERI